MKSKDPESYSTNRKQTKTKTKIHKIQCSNPKKAQGRRGSGQGWCFLITNTEEGNSYIDHMFLSQIYATRLLLSPFRCWIRREETESFQKVASFLRSELAGGSPEIASAALSGGERWRRRRRRELFVGFCCG